MAVPAHLALPHINGNFSLNRAESDSQDRILSHQGVPYALRKVFKLAKIQLNILVGPLDPEDTRSQYRFIIKSSLMGLGIIGAAPLRAVGFPTENTDERILDGAEREKTEPVIGKTKSRVWLCLLEEVLDITTSKGDSNAVTDDFLKEGWEGHDPQKTYVVRMTIWSVDSEQPEPWHNEQIWGIQQGRWTGRVAFTKGTIKETALLKYDYEP